MTGHGSSGMDTEYRSRPVAYLLALKNAPDTTPRDRVRTIGVTAARHTLVDEMVWHWVRSCDMARSTARQREHR
jgi:hypothetical protein